VTIQDRIHVHARTDQRAVGSRVENAIDPGRDLSLFVLSPEFSLIHRCPLSEEEAPQVGRFRYILAHGVKEGLVAQGRVVGNWGRTSNITSVPAIPEEVISLSQ
jgi:hypothetical protein